MKKVYLAQINNSYGNNAFLPYSVALLWAYAQQDQRIRDAYVLGDLLFLRKDLDTVLDEIVEPDVLALSCYIWNWNYNLNLAKLVKQARPGCVVILGGPEVPNRSQGFFLEHTYIDLLIHGEGEKTFADLMVELIKPEIDLSQIKGISYPDTARDTIFTGPAERLNDIDVIPSPYITGIFDGLIEQYNDISFHASQETHRGCPYSCTFCDWGSAVMTKVRQFNTDRLLHELEWFGQHKIDLLYNCDANYGILKRDVDLTKSMIAVKAKYGGFPNKFRAAYAKKSNDKIFEIATLLNDAGMNKGITLSMQSMDDTTLDNVKRSNIKVSDFSNLLAKYQAAAIPTYTEVIVGLPGETYTSFVNGLEQILTAGQHDNISIYMCMLLKNSEMSDPLYVSRHQLRSRKIPLLSLHGSPSASEIVELTDIVVETSTMPYSDWIKSNEIGWLMQCLHCMGLTNHIAKDFYARHGSYMQFYQLLLDNFADGDSVLGQQIAWFRREIKNVFEEDKPWNLVDQSFGSVSWPLEEFSFLQIQKTWQRFYQELKDFLRDYVPLDALDALISFQIDSIHKLSDIEDSANLYPAWLLGVKDCKDILQIKFKADRYFADPMDYAREIVWYGRKSSATKRTMELR